MKQLLSIEFHKLKKLNSFKVILLIYAILSPLVMHMLYKFFNMILEPLSEMTGSDAWNPYQFPDIWRFATYSSSYFNVLMGVIIVVVVTNEYTFRTLKQNVIDGLSIKQVIISKFLSVFVISTIVTVYILLLSLTFGLINSGAENIFVDIEYIAIYYLQTICYFSFAFLFAALLKKPALAIILFIVSFVVETIIGSIISAVGLSSVYAYFPLNAFSKLTPLPIFEDLLKNAQEQAGEMPVILDMSTNIIISLVYMILFFLIAFWVMKRRDL